MPYSVRQVFPFVWRWRSVHGPERQMGFALSKQAAKRAAASHHHDEDAIRAQAPDELPRHRLDQSASTPASP